MSDHNDLIFSLSPEFENVEVEVPRRISPKHINDLFGVSVRDFPDPGFEIPELGPAPNFAPGKLGYVKEMGSKRHKYAGVQHAYWSYLHGGLFTPKDFCDRTDRHETPIYVFSDVPVKCKIPESRGIVFPCMTYVKPKMGIDVTGRWRFCHMKRSVLLKSGWVKSYIRYVVLRS